MSINLKDFLELCHSAILYFCMHTTINNTIQRKVQRSMHLFSSKILKTMITTVKGTLGYSIIIINYN